MGILESLGDSLFANGMKRDAEGLNDVGSGTGADFVPAWDAAFLEDIDGVGLITADSREALSDTVASVKEILADTVKEVTTLTGDVRPGDEAGHEQYVWRVFKLDHTDRL